MIKLLYMGRSSIRITNNDKVIYIDPYAGNGYDKKADLILVTHNHYDHNNIDLIKNRSDDCVIITEKEALKDGVHNSSDLGFAVVEAVEAGNNKNHNKSECVGYLLTIDNKLFYFSGDTSKTIEMDTLSKRNIDYAFYCMDGVYNMDVNEAIECAKKVNAKHNISYHNSAEKDYDENIALEFNVDNNMIIKPNTEIKI